MTQLSGSTPAPLPSTVTQTRMPMSADVVLSVVSILVSVIRPVTKSGRTSSSTPLPLEVLIVVVNRDKLVPPLRAPPAPIVQLAAVPAALKLPLLWAKPKHEIAKQAAAANTTVSFFIHSSPFSRVPGCKSRVKRGNFRHVVLLCLLLFLMILLSMCFG